MSDYLVVGAGLFGATCARALAEAGRRVLVIERDGHVGGMCHDALRDGVRCSSHGGHIFHTRSRRIWDYVNRFAEFVPLYPRVRARAAGQLYSFPINLATLQEVFGLSVPALAREYLAQLCLPLASQESVRDWCLAHIGPQLYRLFIEGYTRKQWGRDPAHVPASVVRRLPVRFTWSDGYFDDPWQGVPVDGFTALIERMLRHPNITLELGRDYLESVAGDEAWRGRRTIYTGQLDALMGYGLGPLAFRSLRWEWESVPVADYQGCAAVNFCDADVPYTREIEFKHFWPAPDVPHTVIAREFPMAQGPAYYPVNDADNQRLYQAYVALAAEQLPHVIPAGRLGGYQYIDMQQAVAAALRLVESELGL